MKQILLNLAVVALLPLVCSAKNRAVQVHSMLEGRVVMCVEPGERVIEGQPLFYIEPTTLKLQKKKNIDAIKHNYKLFQRDKKLIKTHDMKISDFQKIEYNLATAIQDVKITEENILNSYYFAPFDGIITKVVNYTGSGVDDGSEIVDITQITPETNIREIEKRIRNSAQVGEVDSMTEGVMTLHVKLGEHVRKGQLLFNVDTIPEIDHETTYIASQKIKFENVLRYHKETYDRLKKLKKCVKLIDLETAELAYENAKDDLRAFSVNVKHSYYYSPFDAIVTDINNYNGCVNVGTPVVEVTKIKSDTNIKAIEKKLKKSPVITQVDSLMEGILRLKVRLGQHVKKGTLLFAVDTDALESQKGKDLSHIKLYKAQYERMKKLASIHAVPILDFQTAKYNLMNAIADLKTTELSIKNSFYYAPFDGTVTKIINSNGSAIGDGNEVIDIKKDTPLT